MKGELTPTVYPDGVKLTVVKALSIKAADVNGLSDPYCKIQYADKKAVSMVVHATLDPIWNFTVTLPKGTHSTNVIIEIWDKDRIGKDDFLGVVELYSLDLTKPSCADYPLCERSNKRDKRIRGTLQVKVEL